MDVASDPYQVLGQTPTGWLKNYVEPMVPVAKMWDDQF